jgi:hypothetical protein
MVGDIGFEPMNVGIKIRCLDQLGESPIVLVPPGGNDPPTLALSRRCSTTELRRHKINITMNLRSYINIITEATKSSDKVRRDAFIYLEPRNNIKDFAQCSSCSHFMPDSERCTLFSKNYKVVAEGSCSLYVQGVPADNQVIMDSITPKDAGYVVAKVRCENCVALEGTTCTFFETLNQKIPDFFNLDTKVKPRACCNAWAPK